MDNNITLVTGAKKNRQQVDDKNNLEACIQSFSNEVLTNIANIPKMKENLIHLSTQGKLSGHYIRPTAWKIFLNVLPSSESDSLLAWMTTVIEQRKTYKKRIKDLNCLKKLSGDPLGKEKETGWNSFFQDSDIKKIINLDVNRTFQDKPLFNTSLVRDLLCNILFLWAKENKDPCYKQGMNEILAILVFSLYPFYFKNPYEKEQKALNMEAYVENPKDHEKELYHFFHDESELQSDLYFLFTNIMKQGASRMFENPKIEQVRVQGDCETYLSSRCGRIVHEKLQMYDKKLYEHFIKIDLDCQIFLQYILLITLYSNRRWLKCIFNREFHPRDVEVIWDAIFSLEKKNDKSGLEMIDYVSVAMIIFIKKELEAKDQNECFQRLFKYPPIESTLTLIQLASKIKLSNEEKLKAGFVVERKKRPSEEPKTSPNKKAGVATKDPPSNGYGNNGTNGNGKETEKVITSNVPLLNGNIIYLGNKELLDEIDVIFKKYKLTMSTPDVGNYELAMETLRKKIGNNSQKI